MEKIYTTSFTKKGLTRNTVTNNWLNKKQISNKILFLHRYLILSLIVSYLFLSNTAYAAIALRGTATSATTTNTTFTINKPTGVVAGDVMIVNITQTGNTSTNASCAGWTLIAGARQDVGVRRSTILYRVADGSEGSSFVFTLGTGTTSAVGSIIAFSGVNISGATPFDVTPGSLSVGGGTTVTATGITTVTNNAAIVFLAGAGGTDGSIYSGWSGTTPTFTEVMDFSTTTTTNSVGAAWGTLATAGATGNKTVTVDGNYYWAGMLIALKPYSSPGEVITEYFSYTGSAQTFQVPNCVTNITVEAWGGGGAGGGTNSTRRTTGGGGGGGTYTLANNVSVTPGQNINVTVGAGGAGATNAVGGTGGTSTFNSSTQVSAVGGYGGGIGNTTTLNGAGASIRTGVTYNGGMGGTGDATSSTSGTSGAGGGGAGSGGSGNTTNPGITGGIGGIKGTGSSAGGNGANGTNNSGDGTSATQLAAGGSGGRNGGNSPNNRTGGNGAPGLIVVSYTLPLAPTITLGSNPSVCVGTSASLTYSATTGCPDKYSIDFTSGISDVPETNLTGSPIVINTTDVPSGIYEGILTVKNSTYGFVSTGYPITITIIAPGTWLGLSVDWHTSTNWSCGIIPTSSTDVTIPSNVPFFPTISSTATCNNLTLEPGASLLGNSLLNVSAKSELKLNIDSDNKWHFLSSPIANHPIWPEFAPTPSGSPLSFGLAPWKWDFYYFNPNANFATGLYWVNLRLATTGNLNTATVDQSGNNAGFGSDPAFTSGRGYLVAYNSEWYPATGSPKTHTFNATNPANFFSGDLTITRDNSSQAFNLVGNPYPSSLDWKMNNGWLRNDLKSNSGGFDYWIMTGTGNYGVYNSAETDDAGTNGVNRYIAPAQGFMVEATDLGSFTMKILEGARVHSAQSWVKNETMEPGKLRLKIINSVNSFSDEMMVAFNSSYEGNSGSAKLYSWYNEAPEIYSVKGGNNYSIDRYNDLNTDLIVNINTKTGIAAEYTITSTNIQDFSLSSKVLLEDLKTGVVTDLKQTPAYTFAGAPGDDANRFRLIIGSPIGIDEPNTTGSFNIYTYENMVYVQNDKINEPYFVTVSNMLGQTLVRTDFTGNSLNRIEMRNVPGVYVVNVVSNGKTYSQKVVIR